MNRIILLIISLAVWLGVSAAKPADLEFAQPAYDFGTVTDTSAPVVHEYEFTNTTDQAVAVLSASSQCGCTRPEYPTKPIAPGKTGKIKVTFLPAGQMGEIEKTIRVRYRGAKARSSKHVTLRLTGTVVVDK